MKKHLTNFDKIDKKRPFEAFLDFAVEVSYLSATKTLTGRSRCFDDLSLLNLPSLIAGQSVE